MAGSQAIFRNGSSLQRRTCTATHSSNCFTQQPALFLRASPATAALPQAHRHALAGCSVQVKPKSRPLKRSLQVCRATDTEEEVDVEVDAMERMETTVKVTKEKFATIRTGRASPSLLDLVKVDYFGAPTQLKSLANITAPEASQLVVSPFDKGTIDIIEKAILTANLGLTPGNDGKIIRINVPQLTADRRKEMAKSVSKLGEEGKVAIRNVRRDAMKILDQQEKAGDLSEDEQKALEESIQELTDDSVKQIDALIKAKQTELTSV